MADVSPEIIFNPLEVGYTDNPFPHLQEMRRLDPVHASPIGTWMLFDYDDCFQLLRDPALSVDEKNLANFDQERLAAFLDAVDGDVEELERTSILGIDPPDHTRLRRLVSKAFTPRTIEALRPRIQELVDEALDRILAQGQADVISELAFTLPFDVISEMLGMPEGETQALRSWSEDIVKTLDPIITEDEIKAAVVANRAMDAHIANVISWKRENPADDLLTAMIEAEEDGDRMSSQELSDQVGLLFIAGHETTVNLIGTGIAELLGRPDQAQMIRSAELTMNGVDELLRFVSPVQMSRRITTQDIEMQGRTIPTGTMVMAALASANRDDAKWGATGDELDLTRDGAGQHLSFGSGIHYCLGASLAKLEGQVAIGSFIKRFPNATIVDQQFNGRINLRGLERLIVDVTD
ncbi:MAG: cytochrome P450 [Acidimicrobiaceae bacterium]|jgi:cytochrome P450|nr:cytochrome P450 [Acidimicrobiaceae bacterium]MCH9803858.1 cytochrome P450 [bacterium]MDB4102597.1 cytochrome P450 [Acidimicrobiales bacterium]MBT6444451.1 cytochrome P450 [Acidimicrobiaceae bacterium]MCO4833899.1 cytochrome P450 [Acidimicrobiaceae bacterium]